MMDAQSLGYERIYAQRPFSIKYADYTKPVISLLRKYDCKRLLDVGCGRSAVAVEASRFCDITGLDTSRSAVESMAELRLKRAAFVIGDCRNLPFRDESFDVVTMTELIEHFTASDGDKILGEIRRVLEPCGKLILTTPVKKNLLSEFYYRFKFIVFDRGIWFHVKEYTAIELRAKITRFFSVVYSEILETRQLIVGQRVYHK